MIQEVHAHQASRSHLQVSPSCRSCVEGAENRCPYGAAASMPKASPAQLSNLLNLLLDAQHEWSGFATLRIEKASAHRWSSPSLWTKNVPLRDWNAYRDLDNLHDIGDSGPFEARYLAFLETIVNLRVPHRSSPGSIVPEPS